MQIHAILAQPGLRAFDVADQHMNQPPEFWSMVEFAQVRHFMGDDIVAYEGRGEYEPP